MNETKVYYRVLNEEEIIGEFWNSIEDLTSRQQMTQEYYPQIEAICILSLKCDIKLSSALRIATQYVHVISDIQEANTFQKANIIVPEMMQKCVPDYS